ncbi:MAG: hypothetical protein IKA64_04615 [Clostridia bacterium]|nr:hypothetical protein [Clostridia bacterium]
MKNECIEILPRSYNKYKINLHTHSTFSDGNFTPEELKRIYMKEGYSAVAFTDHRECISHNELTDDEFVALTGTELDFTLLSDAGWVDCVHINALSREPDKRRSYEKMPLDYELINKTVDELRRDNFFVTVNHPVWSNMSSDDVLRIKGADAIEIVNGIGVVFNNYSDDSAHYEYFIRKGGRAVPVAGDDSHKIFEDGTPYHEYCTTFTTVFAKELSYGAIIDALDAGRSYASTGPRFESIRLVGDKLCVECSNVFGVYVHSKYLTLKTQDVRKTDSITYTEIDISDIRAKSPYFWVSIRDTKGGKAWATPYWF